MENREAAEIMYKVGKCIDGECPFGDDSDGCSSGCVYYATAEQEREARKNAISALKKQIPVKIYKKWNEYYGRNDPCCGICSAYLNEYEDYCPRCGQSINWEE